MNKVIELKELLKEKGLNVENYNEQDELKVYSFVFKKDENTIDFIETVQIEQQGRYIIYLEDDESICDVILKIIDISDECLDTIVEKIKELIDYAEYYIK